MVSAPRRRGQCPECWRIMLLRKDGMMGVHRRGSMPSRPCLGSGREGLVPRNRPPTLRPANSQEPVELVEAEGSQEPSL